MNYVPIHTNIAPNYNYLSAENAYLKQTIEYKDAVDAVLKLLRIHPPHRIGEAAFMRRLVSLKQKGKPNAK